MDLELTEEFINYVSTNDGLDTIDHVDAMDAYLEHHGILGMHWGERRYQDEHGNWTEEGNARRRKGAARDFAERLSNTAKRASDSISTAARKTFNPTAEDLDEKIAKAKQRQVIKDKKKELALLQGKNRNIKDMTDQEVLNEIQSRANREKLKQMREDSSKIYKGKKFAENIVSSVGDTTVSALSTVGKTAGNIAVYGVEKAAKGAIDTAVQQAHEKSMKNFRDSNKSESEKLQDKLKDVEATTKIRKAKRDTLLADSTLERDRARLARETREEYYRKSILDREDTSSKAAAKRLDRMVKAGKGQYKKHNNK